jgi:hypothetical protein
MKKYGWKLTPASILDDIQKACVEHGHGGLWNSMEYLLTDVVCIDMKACYPPAAKARARPPRGSSGSGTPVTDTPGSVSMVLSPKT